jgi:hypothetical protein
MTWITSIIYQDLSASNGMEQLREDVDVWFNSQDFPVIEGTSHYDPPNSNSLNRTLEIAQQIGTGPVRDGDVTHSGGLIASEFLLAAMVLEGTGIGISVLTRKSGGRINSRVVCEGINLDFSVIVKPSTSFGAWETFSLPEGSAPPAQGSQSWFPEFALSDIKKLPDAPTESSNWLLKSVLMIGEHPGGRADVSR